MRCIKYLKICFQMRKIFDFNVPSDFQPIWTCCCNITEKIKTNFLQSYLQTCFYCHYGMSRNNDLLPSRFLKFPWYWSLLVAICVKEISEHDFSITEVSAVGYIVLKWHWKVTFDFIEILNKHLLKRQKFCQNILWDLLSTFLWSYIHNF